MVYAKHVLRHDETLHEKLREANKRIAALESEIDEWKTSSMLVDSGGDPDGITPAMNEQNIKALEGERDAALDIVREIAREEMFALLESSSDGEQRCIICGGVADIAWDYDDEGSRFADIEFCSVAHTEECPIGRARQIVTGEADA